MIRICCKLQTYGSERSVSTEKMKSKEHPAKSREHLIASNQPSPGNPLSSWRQKKKLQRNRARMRADLSSLKLYKSKESKERFSAFMKRERKKKIKFTLSLNTIKAKQN